MSGTTAAANLVEDERQRARAKELAQGQLPDPKEIETAIAVSAASAREYARTEAHTAQGQVVADRTADVLEAVHELVHEKDLAESFKAISDAANRAIQAMDTNLNSNRASQMRQELEGELADLRAILQDLTMSEGFRKSLRTLNRILLETFASGAEQVRQKAEEQAQEQEKPAEERHEQQTLGQEGEHSISSKVSAKTKDISEQASEKTKDISEQASEKTKDVSEQAKSEVQERSTPGQKGKKQKQKLGKKGKKHEETAKPQEQEHHEGEHLGVEQEEHKQVKESQIQEEQHHEKRDTEEHSESSGEHQLPSRETEHTIRRNGDLRIVVDDKEYQFMEQRLSDDQLNKLADSLQRMMIQATSDNRSTESMRRLVRSIKRLADKVAMIHQDVVIREVEREQDRISLEVKALLEKLANNFSLDGLVQSWEDFKASIRNDEELNEDFQNMLAFWDRSLKSPEEVQRDSWKKEAVEHIQTLRSDLRDHRELLFNVVQELDDFAWNMKEDPYLKRAAKSSQALTDAMFKDSRSGQMKVKTEALDELRRVVSKILREQFKFIALPDIQGVSEDGNFEYRLKNVVLKTEQLIPEQVSLRNSNHLRITKLHKGPDDTDLEALAAVHAYVSGLALNADEVEVWYRKHDFPAMEDQGKADLSIPYGMEIDMWMSGDFTDPQGLHIDDVDVRISSLNLSNLRFKEHQTLYYIFKPIVQYIVRRRVEEALEANLKNSVISLYQLTSSQS